MDFLIPIAQAQPPPDFIYQAGSQALQFSSVVLVGIGFALAWFRSLWMRWIATSSLRKTIYLLLGSLILVSFPAGIFLFSASYSVSPVPLSASVLTSESRVNMPTQSVDGDTLQGLLNSGSISLIDVREDEERSFGFIPGSTQIRMADVFAGAWKNFSKEQPLYLHCATGTRSHDVGEFLAQKGFTTYFLNERLEEWVQKERDWNGVLPFQDEPSRLLKKRIDPEAAFELWNGGSILVDVRSDRRQAMKPVEKSFSLPVIDLSTDDLNARLKSFPSSHSVIILTDNIALSSFSAFLAASKLDELEYRVEGIIYEPQDFLSLL
jgi:rhodanese-related sulfurtransferase